VACGIDYFLLTIDYWVKISVKKKNPGAPGLAGVKGRKPRVKPAAK